MIGSFTNYPSMNSPLGLATQYSLRFGLVVGLDPPRHAVHVSFRDTNEFTGYSLPVLMPWADGYYISQSPLPRKGTLVLCAFPMGDDRNGVVIGSLYGSNLSAITSGVSENDAYIDYARYPNNIWRMADDNANLTWAHPSGLTLNINNSGTTPLSPTYNITSSANPELTEVLPVPAPAKTTPPYIYITHPSGSSLLLDPSGNYTTKITGTSSSSISGNVSQIYLGTMTTQVTSDIQTSSGTQIVNQVGSAASTALTATSATSTIGTISHEVSAAGITASNAGAPFMSVTSAGAMTLLAGVAATGFTIGGNSVVTSFNGAYGAIVADLNTLSGVSISNPTSGQVLTYNGTDWVNGTGGGGTVSSVFGRTGAVVAEAGDYTLAQIGTVSLSSPANGQVLEYNGTDWVNASIVSGVSSVFGRTGAVTAETGDYTLSQIGTVVLTSPTNGQVLTYNGTDWVNAATANAVSSVFGRTGAVTAEAGDYTLSQIGTVSLTSPANGQVLEYNGTDWVNASIVSGVSSVFGRTGAVTAEAGDYSAFYGQLATSNIWTDNQTLTSSQAGTTPLNSPSLTFQGWTGSAAVSESIFYNTSQGGLQLGNEVFIFPSYMSINASLYMNGPVYIESGNTLFMGGWSGSVEEGWYLMGYNTQGVSTPLYPNGSLVFVWNENNPQTYPPTLAIEPSGDIVSTSSQTGTTALASPSFTFQGWSGSAAVDYSIFTDSSGDLEIDYGSTKIITSSSTGVINAAGFTIGGNSVVTSFNGRYGAITPASGDYTLAQIGTVSLSSPANGQVLEYNGTDWINASIVSGVSSVFGRTGAVTAEAGDYTLSQIGTVSLTSPANGQVLEYNGTDWVNASIVSGVSSVFGRTGAVTAEAGDYTLTLVGDGTARFAVVNAGSLNGVSYVDANNRALIDFTQVTQHGNIIDNVREATAAWAASTAVTAGYLIKDSNGNAQEATNDGTTGTSVPTWSTTLNGTTNDNGIIWVMVGTTTMTRIAISNTDGNNNVDLSQPNIVNFNSLYEVDGAGWENTAVWGDVSQTPTTLAGYGITNGQVSLGAAAGTNYILMQTEDDGPFWTSPSVQAGNLNYGNTGIENITLNSSTAFQLGNALEFPNPGVPVAISVRVTGEIYNTYTTNQQIGLYCKVSTDGGSTFTSGTELYYTILANTIHLNVSAIQFVNTVTATGPIIVQLWGYNSGNTDSMTLYAMMEATLYPNISFSVVGPPLSASVPSTATGSCSYTYGSASSCTANTNVTVTPGGGTGGYTYAWAVTSGSGTLTNSTSQTVTVSQTEAGSSGGTQYTTDVDCVVTDSASASVTSNTCAVTQTFTYTYAALTVSVSVTDGSCKATSGNSCSSTSSGKINVTGGDGNYSYSTVVTSGPGTISNATSQTFDITYIADVSYSVTTDTNSTVSDPVVASASATASLTNTGNVIIA